jgi:hypothetical protein
MQKRRPKLREVVLKDLVVSLWVRMVVNQLRLVAGW